MGGKVPSFDDLMNPLLRAMQALGGSGSVEEIYDKVVELERFADDVVAQPHNPEKSNQTELGYRLAWARTYLKKYGLLENSSRGVCALTAQAKGVQKLNPQDVVRAVRGLERKEEEKGNGTETAAPHEVSQEQEWKEKLYGILTQSSLLQPSRDSCNAYSGNLALRMSRLQDGAVTAGSMDASSLACTGS